MLVQVVRSSAYAFMVAASFAAMSPSLANQPRVESAISNVMTLHRPGQDGLATVWDGNKYVQCRWMPERRLRCEAAGSLMQPSLSHVLTPERIARLKALGWQLDPSFGNYVQTFSAGLTASHVADRILEALKEGYDADLANLEVMSDWIKSVPCPQRNGPTQNLAGMINESRAMASTAVFGCSYKPKAGLEPTAPIGSKTDLINTYGARIAGEIQRLRVNIDRNVFFVVETGAGYLQCGPQSSPPAIYCEAQSADSWPVLARILTSDRVARLRAAGFFAPGRAPNYWKTYPVNRFSDAAIADELLTILYEVYGYNGSPALEFKSEKTR